MPLPIRFVDFDSLGHVNNANYLTYFEIGRIHYFNNIVTGNKPDWNKEGIILAKAIVNFRKPIDTFDHHYISIRCSRMGNKSFDLSYQVTREENESVELMAEGTTVMVCFNYETKETIPIKDEWRKAIAHFEQS